MGFLRKFIADCKTRADKRHLELLKEDVKEKYQIKEHDGVLWITLNGQLAIPSYLLNESPLDSLTILRDAYIKTFETD